MLLSDFVNNWQARGLSANSAYDQWNKKNQVNFLKESNINQNILIFFDLLWS